MTLVLIKQFSVHSRSGQYKRAHRRCDILVGLSFVHHHRCTAINMCPPFAGGTEAGRGAIRGARSLLPPPQRGCRALREEGKALYHGQGVTHSNVPEFLASCDVELSMLCMVHTLCKQDGCTSASKCIWRTKSVTCLVVMVDVKYVPSEALQPLSAEAGFGCSQYASGHE